MQRFRKILVGLELADGTNLVSPHGLRDRCSDALAKATWLASETGAELRIVHALPISPRTYDMLERHGGPGSPSLVDQARARLEEIAERSRDLGVRSSSVVRVGAASVRLPEEAESWGADLIVVAGRNRGSRVGLLGSTAARVFRTSDVPVWVARRGARTRLRDIVAAVALDDHSHGVLRLAADTARRTGARLHVVHATESTNSVRRAIALDALVGWTRAHADDVEVTTVEVLEGSPAEAILTMAAGVPADAVFIGPSKRSAVLAKLMGDAATPLLKQLDCSLICARGVSGSPRWPRLELRPRELATF